MLQKKSRRSWVWTWQDSEIKDFSQEGPDVQGTASPLDDKRQREGAAWAIAAVAIADIAKRRELLPLPLPALESQEEREERRGTRAAAGLCSTLSLLLLRCPGCVCTAVLLCLLQYLQSPHPPPPSGFRIPPNKIFVIYSKLHGHGVRFESQTKTTVFRNFRLCCFDLRAVAERALRPTPAAAIPAAATAANRLMSGRLPGVCLSRIGCCFSRLLLCLVVCRANRSSP